MINISNSELEVMKILWEKREANSLEIIEVLAKEHNWDNSTIRTLIIRLKEKGAIEASKKEGRIYTYIPKIDENEYVIKESKNFLNRFYKGSLKDMLLNFANNDELSKSDLEELIDIIESER